MSITGIINGGQGTFTATPQNAAGKTVPLPQGIVPIWSIDNGNVGAIASQSNDGLSCVVNGLADGTFNLTVSATLAPGNVVTATAPVTVMDGVVTTFQINQTS